MPIPMTPTIFTAFVAGLISFLSPCVLPMVPTYLTYLAGGVGEASDGAKLERRARRMLLGNAVLFIVGFSLVFVAFGATATALGQFLGQYSVAFAKIGAVIVIAFGLSMIGLLPLPWLQRDMRLQIGGTGGPLGAFLLGISFSAGWTACVGPILMSILMLAGQTGTVGQGVLLLAAYTLGLALPFLAAALLLTRALTLFRQLYKHFKTIQIVSGLLLVGIGLMLWTGSFMRLSSLFNWRF